MNINGLIGKALAPVIALASSNAELSFRPIGDDGNEVEVLIYQPIGSYEDGITSKDFAEALADVTASTIHVRFDCPGGDVFMARAMKTALEQHSAKVIGHIDGVCASAASYLMLACDELEIADGAMIMVHNAWGLTIGDYRDHAASGELLSKVDAAIRADYAKKSGKPADHFAALMDAETWFSAQEALDEGLVDRVYEKAGGVQNRFNLDLYANAPDEIKAGPVVDEEDWAARRAVHARRMDILDRLAQPGGVAA